MNFEAIKDSLDKISLKDGFQPADLLDLPAEVVPILKQVMTRRGNSVAALSAALHWQEDDVSHMLNILENKGLVQRFRKDNKVVFMANMK